MTDVEEYLSNIYYDAKHPASYGSVGSLFKFAKQRYNNISLNDIKLWLSKQLTYTLHRYARKNFLRNRIYVTHMLQQWQADLVDMKELVKENDGYKYLLTVIDCFSKYLWVIPLKVKTSKSVIDAFKRIFKEAKPLKIQTDRGTEFNNKEFKAFCLNEKVRYFTSQDVKIKCSIVERVNRTLKEKMFKYFTANGTRKYIDNLDELVKSYNHRWHRSIKMCPVDVNETNERLVFKNLYGVTSLKDIIRPKLKNKNDLKVGSDVRRKYDLSQLDRGYYPNWTDNIFKIDGIIDKIGKFQYIIKDYKKVTLPSRFYKEELQPVTDTKEYRIEKILNERKRGNNIEFLVKWIGFPSSDNTWINKKDLINLKARMN